MEITPYLPVANTSVADLILRQDAQKNAVVSTELKKSDAQRRLENLTEVTKTDTSSSLSLFSGQSTLANTRQDFMETVGKTLSGTQKPEEMTQIKATIRDLIEHMPNAARDAVVLSQTFKKSTKDREVGGMQDIDTRDGEVSTATSRLFAPPPPHAKAKATGDANAMRVLADTVQKDPLTKDAVSSYVSSFAASIFDKSEKKRAEVRTMKNALIEKGIDPSTIKKVETQVSQIMTNDLKKQIRRSFVDMMLSYSTQRNSVETAQRSLNHKVLSDLAELSGMTDSSRGEIKDLEDESRFEMRNFLAGELDTKLVEGKLRGDTTQDLVRMFNRFQTLVDASKFDSSSYVQGVLKKLTDQGLDPILMPKAAGVVDTEMGRGNPDGKPRNKEEYQLTLSIQSIQDQLRILVMQKSVSSGWLEKGKCAAKITNLKRALKQMGAYDDDTWNEVLAEGAALAKNRLIDLLHEAYEERASMFELKGPAYDMVKKKLRLAVRGLKKMGEAVTAPYVYGIRDQVNRSVFFIIKEEYLRADAMLTQRPTAPELILTVKNYGTLLSRLQTESDIQEPIQTQMFQDRVKEAGQRIVEAA